MPRSAAPSSGSTPRCARAVSIATHPTAPTTTSCSSGRGRSSANSATVRRSAIRALSTTRARPRQRLSSRAAAKARASSDAHARTATPRSMAATIRRARASSGDARGTSAATRYGTGRSTMRFRPYAKTLAAGLCVAPVSIGSLPARADSAVGFDDELASATTLGLARGWGIALDPDEEPKRSPNGILYKRTPPPPEAGVRTEDGWEVSGVAEAGGSWSSGDTSDYFFRRYKDV